MQIGAPVARNLGKVQVHSSIIMALLTLPFPAKHFSSLVRNLSKNKLKHVHLNRLLYIVLWYKTSTFAKINYFLVLCWHFRFRFIVRRKSEHFSSSRNLINCLLYIVLWYKTSTFAKINSFLVLALLMAKVDRSKVSKWFAIFYQAGIHLWCFVSQSQWD